MQMGKINVYMLAGQALTDFGYRGRRFGGARKRLHQ